MLKFNKNVKYIYHGIISVLLVGLMILGSFLDMQISKELFNVGLLSKIGSGIGKIPAYWLVSFAGAILFKSAQQKEKKTPWRMPLMVIYAFVVLGGSLFLGYSMVDDLIQENTPKLITALIITALNAATMYAVVKLISMENVNRLRKWAFVTIFTVAFILIFTYVMKIAWGRVRYADIMAGNGSFSAWYIPSGMNGNSSMPSGHVALAACIFLLVPLFRALPRFKSVEIGVACFSFAFTLIIALTRIMGGHHFLTDVSVSIIIAYVTISVSNRIAYGSENDKYFFKQGSIFNRL